MSTGKATVTENRAEIDRAALAAQQEAERTARLRRLSDAGRKVETCHTRYSSLQNRLYEGQCSYPADLSFSMPSLPLPTGAGDDPAEVERYAAVLHAHLTKVELNFDQTLAAAKAAHEDRIAKQEAWQKLHEHDAALQLLGAELINSTRALGEVHVVTTLAVPAPDSDLATLEANLRQRQSHVKDAQERLVSLQRRQQDRARQHAQTGAAVTAESSTEALGTYHAAQAEVERHGARELILACLREISWRVDDVSGPIAQQIHQVETRAGAERIAGLLRQCRSRHQSQNKAKNLLLKPPPHFDPALQKDWANFVDKIQSTVNGNTGWDESLIYEHQDIQSRATALMKVEFQMSQIRQRAAEAGLDVVDSDGLVTLNLHGLARGYAYEVRHLGQQGERTATHFQLVAGTGTPVASDEVAAVVGCQQLKAILPADTLLIEADDLLDQCYPVPVMQVVKEENPATMQNGPSKKKRRVTSVRKKAFSAG